MPTNELTLVLMAAGMGSRYGGLKQMDAFGPHGETLMDYSVHDALRAGFKRVVFVIRKDFEPEFREKVASRYAGRVKVDLALQALQGLPEGFAVPQGRQKPWGTGHALLSAAPLIDGPFCICNADDFYGADAYASMAAFLHSACEDEAALVGFDLGATLSEHGSVARGVCQVSDGQLLSVSERLKLRRDGDTVLDEASGERFDLHAPVSMNFWGFHPSALKHFESIFRAFLNDLKDPSKEEFYLPMAVEAARASKLLRVKVLAGGRRWFGVTYPQDSFGAARLVGPTSERRLSGAGHLSATLGG